MKAQSGMEFVVVVAVVLAFIVFILVSGFRESEISLAMAAARQGAAEFAAENGSLVFTSMRYGPSASDPEHTINVNASIYYADGSTAPHSQAFRNYVAEKMRLALSPRFAPTPPCAAGANYLYCVV